MWLQIFDFLREHWDKVITIIISLAALIISALTWLAQRNFSKKYKKATNVIICNSIKLALYDIDLLIYKVNHVQDQSFDSYQLTFQIHSLEDNLKLIENIKVDQLPKNDTLNYQTYRKDLVDAIYKINSDIEKFKIQIKSYQRKDKNQIGSARRYWKGAILNSCLIVRSQLLRDREYIEKQESIFDEKYANQLASMDSEAEVIAKNVDYNGLKYVNHD